MRKKTVNLITVYQSVGALVNFITMLVLISLDTHVFESLITILAVNACYILISRDVSRKQELIYTGKNQTDKRPDTGPIHHP